MFDKSSSYFMVVWSDGQSGCLLRTSTKSTEECASVQYVQLISIIRMVRHVPAVHCGYANTDKKHRTQRTMFAAVLRAGTRGTPSSCFMLTHYADGDESQQTN